VTSPSPPFDSDTILFGRADTTGIVDLEPVFSNARLQARMRVYTRSDNGSIAHTEEPFYPFFFLSNIRSLGSYPRRHYRYKELQGSQYYRYLVTFSSWSQYREAIRVVKTNVELSEALYLIRSPAQQYLMQTGQTCFKDMAFDSLHRLQLDIEVASTRGFPNASRPGDAIVIVSLTDNRGWQCLLHLAPDVNLTNGLAFADEAALLRHLVHVLRERDPDVIEGHNIFRFDFPYIISRCRRHGVSFGIGRAGEVPRTFPSSVRFAERSIEFEALDIPGRHIVDTLFLLMSYDVFKRDLPGYGLKAAARYFGLTPENRTYVEGDQIGRIWREDPARLLAYALDDVIETERLARHLSGSAFYLTQMLPMRYGRVARSGPAAKIESLFVREYLRRKHSLPASRHGTQSTGGYTDIFVTGVAGPIVYADVESLYPSIMLRYDVRPASDTLGIFPALLRRLTDLRFEAKAAMNAAATPEKRSELDARQTSYKNLINAFYGYLGFSKAVFNDYAEAERVTTTGQQLLRRIIGLIRDGGGKVIEVDTDGVFFVPPPGIEGEAAERQFLAEINDFMPEGIRIGFDGRFRKMLSYKKKNYALLDYEDRVKIKGSSLVSRSTERFGRQFVRAAIILLLDGRLSVLHDLYLTTRARIVAHEWDDVADFSRTETLKQSLDRYEADVAAGKRPRAASYELARRRMRETGQPVRKGDRISFYLTGTSARINSFEKARSAASWDPSAPDENTAHYLRRLDELTRKFTPFFAEHHFRLLFSPEDLFGFSADGITLVSTDHPIDEPDTTR